MNAGGRGDGFGELAGELAMGSRGEGKEVELPWQLHPVPRRGLGAPMARRLDRRSARLGEKRRTGGRVPDLCMRACVLGLGSAASSPASLRFLSSGPGPGSVGGWRTVRRQPGCAAGRGVSVAGPRAVRSADDDHGDAEGVCPVLVGGAGRSARKTLHQGSGRSPAQRMTSWLPNSSLSCTVGSCSGSSSTRCRGVAA
jgi:hypothetical protein